ncbi:glycosyltransferase [Peribacillus frigoritolerans]|nr:glycosyltransferase [Peribacillus frigoritolerans]
MSKLQNISIQQFILPFSFFSITKKREVPAKFIRKSEVSMITIMIGILTGLMLLYKIPSLQSGQHSDGRKVLSNLSIIIPARNEEKNISRLLTSLEKEKQEIGEIMVVDDGSEDKTAEIAASLGARVIAAKELPPGWLGKSWACFTGAEQAKGEWLMFIDADTFFEQNGAAQCAAAFLKQRAEGMLSVHPFHSTRKPYESFSAFFHLVTFAATGAFHIMQGKGRSAGGFGQCMICTKKDYFVWGGHEAIKNKVVENMAFAEHVRKQGAPVYCASGKGAISMRMYPDGVMSLIRGFSKTFASGAKATKWHVLLAIIIWLTGCLSFFTEIGVLFSKWWFLYVLLYIAAMLQIWISVKEIGRFGLWTVCFFPVYALFFMVVFLASLWKTFVRKSASWKGRNIIVREDA